MSNMSPENEAEYVRVQLDYLREIAGHVESIKWALTFCAAAVAVYGAMGINLLRDILQALESKP